MDATPKWLTEQFLTTCLQDNENERKVIKVKSFNAATLVPEGNNYASCLLRVKVEYEDEITKMVHSLSVIVKSPLTTQAADLVKSYHLVEPIFYYKFLPEANKLTKFHFIPKPYFSPISSVIVMEDLRDHGYVMPDRFEMVDFEHCRFYATAAASYHAISVAVVKNDPGLIELMGTEKVYSYEHAISKYFKLATSNGLQCMAEEMKKTEYKNYSKLVCDASFNLWDKLCNAVKPREGFNCLTQGDPWTTNMMFKYDDSGNIEAIKLLDFQVIRYASPLTDLVMFWWLSANHDVRENRLNDFLHIYCNTLNRKLEELGCSERFFYEEAMQALMILSPLSLMVSSSIFPVIVQPGMVDITAEDTIDSKGKPINKLAEWYNKDYCSNHLPRILKQLDDVGVFKYLESGC